METVADVVFRKPFHESRPFHRIDLHHKKMMGVVVGVRWIAGKFEPFHVRETFSVVIDQFRPAPVEFLQPAKLGDPQGRLDIRQIVLVPRFLDIVFRVSPFSVAFPGIAFDAVKPQYPQFLFELPSLWVIIPPSPVVMFFKG